MMTNFFSIIIPSLNEEISLPVLLKSITKQTCKDFEIIIVDSGSTDKTKTNAIVFKNTIPHFHFIEHKCKNVSMARNYGASLARGDFLIFFDADVEIEKYFLEKIAQRIHIYNLNALTVWNRPREKSLKGTLIYTMMNLSMSLIQKINPTANGPCIIIRKDLFEKTKGFDETIVFGEDFDLIRRAAKKNMKFAVFTKPLLFVSTRRFIKEGFFLSLYKAIKALLHQFLFGPIRKPLFKYEMGGQYYENKK